MKKLSIALATLAACAFTVPAFASSYSDLMDRTTVKVGLNFTEADGHGTDYLYSPSNCLGSTGNDYKRINSLHPDSHFDWSIGVAYRLNCSNTSFVVEYDQFRDTTRVNTTAEGISYAYAFGVVSDTNRVISSVRYDEQDWKFGFRRTMNYCRAEVVLGALLEYAQISRDLNNSWPSSVTKERLSSSERVKGWGPAFDLDTTVKLCGSKQHAFNAFARVGVSLLRTDNDYRQTLWATGNVEEVVPIHSFCGERTHSVVSKLDMAIGLGWKCAMTCCPDIAVRAGVKYLNYSNLFKSGSVHLGTIPGNNENIPVLPERAVGDYGRFGPFVEFSIGGAKA